MCVVSDYGPTEATSHDSRRGIILQRLVKNIFGSVHQIMLRADGRAIIGAEVRSAAANDHRELRYDNLHELGTFDVNVLTERFKTYTQNTRYRAESGLPQG